MATTYTLAWRLAIIQTGDPAVRNQWGVIQDATMPLIEQGAVGMVSVSINGLTTYTLTTANNGPDQSRYLRQSYTGALVSACTVTVPNVNKIGWAQNSTTGGQNVILSPGGGTTAIIPPDGLWYFYATDGSNNAALLPIGITALRVLNDAVVSGNASIGVNLTVGGILSSASVATGAINCSDIGATGNVGVTGSVFSNGGIATTGNFHANGSTQSTDGTNSAVLLPDGGILQFKSGLGANFTGYEVVGFGHIGGIVGDGSGGVAYTSVSDYRLKNIRGRADTGQLIDNIPVYDACFKSNPNIVRPMFLAHELPSWCVIGEKDATDITGDVIPQLVDNSMLVPTLLAEIQSLRRRVEALEKGQ